MRIGKVLVAALFVALMSPLTAHADLVSCGIHNVTAVYIQGDRDDNHVHANTAMAAIDGPACNGSNLVYIENTSKNYHAFLSGLLTAHASNFPINLWVNTNQTITGATQIAVFSVIK